jgi:DNA-directed RNA polymerase alpha subunit
MKNMPDCEVFDRVKRGQTYRSIGRDAGVTGASVCRAYAREIARRADAANPRPNLIRQSPLSRRITNALGRAGVHEFSQLPNIAEETLLRQRSFGARSLAQLKRYLEVNLPDVTIAGL